MLEHTTALLALLRADVRLTVHDGPAPDGAVRPYVVVYVHVPGESRTKLDGPTDETWVTVTTHSVADTAEGARIVARNVRSVLLDKRPVVAGWVCDRIAHAAGRPATWDESTQVTVMDAVDQWDYRAAPL